MNIYIEELSLGQLKTNCYILHHEDKAIIIDPADDATFISDKLSAMRLEPIAIIATHGHFDHVLVAGDLQLIHNIPLYIHAKDEFLLKNISGSVKYWTNTNVFVVEPTIIKHLNQKYLDIPSFENIEIIETPGHTPGSICLYWKNCLISGDTLFNNDIGRCDFAYSSHEQMKKSLAKLMKLPESTEVLPGHGERTYIKNEKRN